ncbi:MAG: hypothetical protein WAU11_07380 [Ignavibacteriaceae bacterium]
MKKIIIISLIVSTALYSTGCYSPKYITKEDWLKSAKGDIKVLKFDNTSYILREGWYEVKSDTMFIISKSKFNINPIGVSYIALSDIKEIEKKEYNGTNTAIMITVSTVVITLLVGVIIFFASIKQ